MVLAHIVAATTRLVILATAHTIRTIPPGMRVLVITAAAIHTATAAVTLMPMVAIHTAMAEMGTGATVPAPRL